MPKKGASHAKTLAAKVLVEQVPASRALSHEEKRVTARILAGTPDGELPTLTRNETEQIAGRPHVRDALIEALAAIGVNTQSLAQVIADGLKAEDNRFGGPDHSNRHKYLETTLRVVGAGPKADAQPPNVGVFVFRSFLGDKPIDVKVGAPEDAVVKRRLKAAKVSNRSYA